MGKLAPIDGFAQRLTRLIERLQVERQHFASACGLSNSMISGYCNGRHAPSLGPIQRGIEALKVTHGPEVLWWLSSGENPPSWLDDPEADPFEENPNPPTPTAPSGAVVPAMPWHFLVNDVAPAMQRVGTRELNAGDQGDLRFARLAVDFTAWIRSLPESVRAHLKATTSDKTHPNLMKSWVRAQRMLMAG